MTIEQNYAGLSPNELVLLKDLIAAINEGLPNSAQRAPGEVFEHVMSALRMAEAKLLDATQPQHD